MHPCILPTSKSQIVTGHELAYSIKWKLFVSKEVHPFTRLLDVFGQCLNVTLVPSFLSRWAFVK
jgi:hypothetical protein